MEQINNHPDTALLVMDFQIPIVAMLPDSKALLNSTADAIKAARKKGLPILYVVVGFREGYPEVSANNQSFSNIKKSGQAIFDKPEGSQVHTAVAPQAGDLLVVKKRISAFAGSDLELILRSMDIKSIVLSGISTSGVVLSTLREAADKDYRITVLSDCCADPDQEVHDLLFNKIFPRQATVLDLEAWKSEME